MQPRFDGFRPQAEQIGGFFYAHPFDNPCNEDGAESIGKLIDRLLQHRAYLALRHGFLRIAAGRRGRKMNDLRLIAVDPVGLPVDRRFPAPQSPKASFMAMRVIQVPKAASPRNMSSPVNART